MLSLLTLADEKNKAELDAGALMRYLAEAVWFPTALLPTAGVQWTSLSDDKALATLSHGAATVSLEFHFNEAHEVTRVDSPGRYRAVRGTYELTPWTGHHRNYRERDGMRVPTAGEVEWHLPDGKFPVWKGETIAMHYEFLR